MPLCELSPTPTCSSLKSRQPHWKNNNIYFMYFGKNQWSSQVKRDGLSDLGLERNGNDLPSVPHFTTNFQYCFGEAVSDHITRGVSVLLTSSKLPLRHPSSPQVQLCQEASKLPGNIFTECVNIKSPGKKVLVQPGSLVSDCFQT